VLRKTFQLKAEELTGKWRKLHNEELQNLFILPHLSIKYGAQIKDD
jgi:hypothetical protein